MTPITTKFQTLSAEQNYANAVLNVSYRNDLLEAVARNTAGGASSAVKAS